MKDKIHFFISRDTKIIQKNLIFFVTNINELGVQGTNNKGRTP